MSADQQDLRVARRDKSIIDLSRIDRLPPHSIEAEQGILGCIFLEPRESISACIEFGLSTIWFYDLRHQTIWEYLWLMYEENEAIDLITVHQKLKDAGVLEAVGGLSYLSSLSDTVPSASNLPHYLEIIREKHVLHKMIKTCQRTIIDASDHEGEVEQLVDAFERDALNVRLQTVTIWDDPRDLTHRAITRMDEAHKNPGRNTGMSTTLKDLDYVTGGIFKSELTVVAARPSCGKTSWLMQMALHHARNDLPVGIFSLEMTRDQLWDRMFCSMAKVTMRKIRDGLLNEEEQKRMVVPAGYLAKAPLYIDDTAMIPISMLKARARRMYQRHGVRIFFVDYLQLVRGVSPRSAKDRRLEVAEVVAELKALAKELQVPVVAAAQLSREHEREKRRPTLRDLREAGDIENDADLIVLLYQDPGKEPEEEPLPGEGDTSILVSMIVAKSRNGPQGFAHATFLKPFFRFEDAAKDYGD